MIRDKVSLVLVAIEGLLLFDQVHHEPFVLRGLVAEEGFFRIDLRGAVHCVRIIVMTSSYTPNPSYHCLHMLRCEVFHFEEKADTAVEVENMDNFEGDRYFIEPIGYCAFELKH